jgi:hypothetical protein
MAEPITATAIATLLVQELAKSSAGEAGKKLVGDLWGAIARRFKGNVAAERTLAEAKVSLDINALRMIQQDFFIDGCISLSFMKLLDNTDI